MEIYVGLNVEKVIGRLETHDARMLQAVARWQELVGPLMVREAQRLTPIRTGKTRASWFAETRGSTIRIGSRSPIAVYLNNGTRPHIIRPLGKKALRFYVGGKAVFAKLVHHPGTKGQRMLQRALENKKDFIIALLKQYTLQESQLLD